MTKDQPGCAGVIQVKRAVQGKPVLRGYRPVAVGFVRARQVIGDQYGGSPPFVVFPEKSGEHIITALVFMDLRRPKVLFGIKITAWAESREGPRPILQILSYVQIKPGPPSPDVRVGTAKQVIFPALLVRENEGVADLELRIFPHLYHTLDLRRPAFFPCLI